MESPHDHRQGDGPVNPITAILHFTPRKHGRWWYPSGDGMALRTAVDPYQQARGGPVNPMPALDVAAAAMSAQQIADARVLDALRWVAQEAQAIVMVGVPLPRGSRLREAFEQLDEAHRKWDAVQC